MFSLIGSRSIVLDAYFALHFVVCLHWPRRQRAVWKDKVLVYGQRVETYSLGSDKMVTCFVHDDDDDGKNDHLAMLMCFLY